ncbi:GAF domain-containing protein [Intrasporangium calvum]|uniref:Phytochrome sensor protein n=1 Tax=Intrasporangium calvum (strain ATCC 23552 / DSM 43043 / JCM 3097 / NBRC 12989 / NCIMB 10167 / NRRL B-3866 / 7 KIP) TaxID=710696 RepID=E6S6W2_INTC7|nr:GAF domain-containing protein [Intrasporangium calvum]ADU46848.1 putative phytochrome sensor protein [Intrasporangium calvum DSM 43043]
MAMQPYRDRGVRAQVAESWVRSAAAGVQADTVDAPITLAADVLHDHREAHPLAAVFPALDDVLGQAARDCDAIMAVSDAAGQLLWVCGTPSVLRRAEAIGFVEGSNWDERVAGTNAPGMALRLDAPVRIIGAEHFRRSVQRWSCAATPIHDPSDQSLLGVLDITCADELVVPQTMAMVRAAARMAEAELARELLVRSRPGGSGTERQRPGLGAMLEVLGRDEALLRVDDGHGRQSTLRLSRRHSEILLLLAAAPRGLSGDELAVLLYEDDVSPSTLRVELGRLRSLLGDELLASRPYRLVADVSSDWLAVESHLAAGAIGQALRAYRGPLLPRSAAPGVSRLRDGLAGSVRRAVLASREADLMSTWTRSSWGADDYEMWQAQLSALGTRSPLRPLVTAQLARLDRELGTGTEPSGIRTAR